MTVGANALKGELAPAAAAVEETVGEAEMSKLAFAAPLRPWPTSAPRPR